MSSSGPWKGDEVTDKTGGEGEAAAERAGGRGPVAGAAANGEPSADRGRPGQAASVQRIGGKVDTAEADQIQEEKRQAAVEQHQEDRAAGTGTAPKNI
jgi:hypothetical protein